jgi:pyruvate-ferredoxin/flavodoxin oxidoreductase
MGRRINTIMQTCFFALSGVLPRDEAIAKIKDKIHSTYSDKGEELVRMNIDAVDATLSQLHPVEIPADRSSDRVRPPVVRAEAPQFIHDVTARMLAGKGDYLPVSAFMPDGTWPTATSQWAKNNIALEIPIWEPDLCIQCNKCAVICPHAAIRVKVFDNDLKADAPASLQTMAYKGREFKDDAYIVQVAPEDCTGCNLCVQFCPGVDKENPEHRAINMQPKHDHIEAEKTNYDFFLAIPETPRTEVPTNLKGSQFLRPLFEYSGACAGCGETPYIKMMTQLFGDRTLIANATGCSSIFGGNLPTTPYCVNKDGRGPAWANSLFEDNAEFGLGMRLAVDSRAQLAKGLLLKVAGSIGDELVSALVDGMETGDEAGIKEQRARVAQLLQLLAGMDSREAVHLKSIADYLVRKNVWIVGGDGWAYDIGYGGLDHVLASGENVNILVLDTEVYSNTGGQSSKATPRAAIAKFAANGKPSAKKNLSVLAMMHDGVYVATVALGAKDAQAYKALVEAESWDGPSLIVAYSPCIAHGYDLGDSAKQAQLAVDSGYWPLFRYDPRRVAEGKNPLQLDSKAAKIDVSDFAYNELRFRMLKSADPDRAAMLMKAAQQDANRKFELLERLAKG